MPKTLSTQIERRVLGAVGTHCILELYDCPPNLLNDLALIEKVLKEAAEEANSTLLNQIGHQFSPHGITAIALLAESHISIHTWPEAGYAAVDVFTCGDVAKPQLACHCLVKALQAGNHCLKTLERTTSSLNGIQIV